MTSPTCITVPRGTWWRVAINYPEGIQQLCADYVLQHWQYNVHAMGGYTRLWSGRFPERSRDYQDNGEYFELIGFCGIPLALARWNWAHCSCYEWDNSLKGPVSVMKFSSYCALRANELENWPENRFRELPINEKYICVKRDDDSSDYVYRKMVEWVADQLVTDVVEGEVPKVDSDSE